MADLKARNISELTTEIASQNKLIFAFGEVMVTEVSGPLDARVFRHWWSKPSWWRIENYKPGCHIGEDAGLSLRDDGRLTHFMIPPNPLVAKS